MTREDLVLLFDEEVAKQREILLARNKAYASNEDALYNIKRNGFKGVIHHIEEKTIRLQNVINNKTMNAEQQELVKETCRDLSNYSFLFRALLEE